MEKFIERLKELRMEKELSQMELAKLTGLSRSAIGFYESGQREPGAKAIITLARFFNVSTDYLLGVADE
ncbi:MAG: helix-turn-helix transcriptional regulator [Clostridia bacterium]|jgi:transcriptional regulator with XRE-family HTH domain|nr:helix-turn-helix transcriptional regulator [Clostridia bacterium]